MHEMDDAKYEIVAHNHPSGNLKFSENDYLFSEGLAETGRLLNIRFLDSMVISRRGFVSMRREYPEIFEQTAKMDIMAKLAG